MSMDVELVGRLRAFCNPRDLALSAVVAECVMGFLDYQDIASGVAVEVHQPGKPTEIVRCHDYPWMKEML